MISLEILPIALSRQRRGGVTVFEIRKVSDRKIGTLGSVGEEGKSPWIG